MVDATALRYSREHLVVRAKGGTVPLAVAGPDVPLPTSLRHRNELPVSAFDLPAERFGVAANLIECVTAAVATMTGRPEAVVSPVGSVVYARRAGALLWDLVHDIDVWCYLPGEALGNADLHTWHVSLQKSLHAQFRSRGVRSRLTWPNRYVTLIDDAGRSRMVELKIAHLEWLATGLEVVHHRFCGLRARRGRAYSLKPRLEWAAYSAFENHYPSPAATEAFRHTIAAVPPQRAMTGLQFMYHENLAGAMRRFGPAHVVEARASDARLQRHRHGVLKKILMLSVMRRDEKLRQSTIAALESSPSGDRRTAVAALIAVLDDLATVDRTTLAQWLTAPTGA